MKKVGLAVWQTSNGLPSASDPETEADRKPRESLLACMTANHEPSNRSFEIDREATVCAASRRFLPLCGREAALTRGTSLAGPMFAHQSPISITQMPSMSTRRLIFEATAVIRWTIAMFTPCNRRHRVVSACPARHSAKGSVKCAGYHSRTIEGAISTMTQRAGTGANSGHGRIQYDALRHCAYELHS
jgi:hypothetical protein